MSTKHQFYFQSSIFTQPLKCIMDRCLLSLRSWLERSVPGIQFESVSIEIVKPLLMPPMAVPAKSHWMKEASPDLQLRCIRELPACSGWTLCSGMTKETGLSSSKTKTYLIKLHYIENILFTRTITILRKGLIWGFALSSAVGQPKVHMVSKNNSASTSQADRSSHTLTLFYLKLICTHAHIHQAPSFKSSWHCCHTFPPFPLPKKKSVRKTWLQNNSFCLSSAQLPTACFRLLKAQVCSSGEKRPHSSFLNPLVSTLSVTVNGDLTQSA